VVCLAIKPVVDGLEREFEGKAYVVRVELGSSAGRELGPRYDIDTVPSFVVFDRSGKVVFRRNGSGGVPLKELRRALRG
jgi:thiol-disulfide isomerase/thioredoxin